MGWGGERRGLMCDSVVKFRTCNMEASSSSFKILDPFVGEFLGKTLLKIQEVHGYTRYDRDMAEMMLRAV